MEEVRFPIDWRQTVDRYLADIQDPDRRLAYLQRNVRKTQADTPEVCREILQAMAEWRLRQQL